MKVFIVLHGELHEGGSVYSVHENKKEAIQAALATKCCFSGGWVEDRELSWENGCDFVKVEEWEVA